MNIAHSRGTCAAFSCCRTKYHGVFPSFLPLFLYLILASPAWSEETAYVTDVLYVPIRSGATNQHRIVNKGLKSGSKLAVLEANSDNTWSKIRTQKGLVGWIQNQYLVKNQTANLRLANAEKKLTSNTSSLAKAKENVNVLTNKLNHEVAAHKKCLEDKTTMSLELQKIKSISSGAIEMDQRYQELLEQHQIIQTKYDTVLAENSGLRSDQRLSFLLYGAGLVIFGMILMILLPMLKPKRRFSEWR